MSRGIGGWGTIGALALMATPVAAEDAPPSAAATAVADRAALEKAQTELALSRIKTLGLSNDATGATEVKGSGGEFEGWLLSANAIDAAAAGIAAKLPASANILFLAGDDKVDLALGTVMAARLQYLALLAAKAQERASCSATVLAAGDHNAAGAAAPLLPYLGALLGAFKTDTTVTGFAGPTEARMVIAALARYRPVDGKAAWIIPSEQVGVPADAALLKTWSGVLTSRDAIERCRDKLSKGLPPEKAKDRIDQLDAALKIIDDFATKQVGAGDGVSPLIAAARIDAIAALKPQVVRIYVEKAGGSMLLRKNLWTALGAPAVGVTGGAVIGWRRINPETGALLAGGNLALPHPADQHPRDPAWHDPGAVVRMDDA